MIAGRRVAQGSAFRSPFTGHRAIGKLDEVESILNVAGKLVERAKFAGVKLACHTTIQDRQRLSSNVLAELEKLKEA